MEWKNSQIGDLLKSQAVAGTSSDDDAMHEPGAMRHVQLGSLAFAIFLEPPGKDEQSASASFGEKVIDELIKTFSQKPTLVHTELIIPPFVDPKATKVHFATYLGSQADYQNQYDRLSGVDWYLIQHGRRWRAIPVIGDDAVHRLRASCDANVGSAYSLAMYPTSSHYFRNFSWIWSDYSGHCGHCATLTARVLKEAGLSCGVHHRPPWYSPSSLYASLRTHLSRDLEQWRVDELKPTDADACEHAIETILRGPLSAKAMADLGHEACVSAIRELSRRVVVASRDGSSVTHQNMAQRELGDAVLKWCLIGRDV